jgi:3-methyladenine DNA glycosylase/8-oxoguanine DNA glycosylase
VRRGGVYYEKNAFYLFALTRVQSFSDEVDLLFRLLKYPLSILESIETYPESPEGWIVPILTEPFEEGVREAIGGKKKK